MYLLFHCLNAVQSYRFAFTTVVDVISRLEPVTSQTKAGPLSVGPCCCTPSSAWYSQQWNVFKTARWSISHWYVLPLSVLGWAHRGPGYFRAQSMLLLEQKLRRQSFWQHERRHSKFKKVRVVKMITQWCCGIWNTQSRVCVCVNVSGCVLDENSSSVGQEIAILLWNTKVHYFIHNRQPLFLSCSR